MINDKFYVILILIFIPFCLKSQNKPEENQGGEEMPVLSDNSKKNSNVKKRFIRDKVYRLEKDRKFGFEVNREIKIPIEYDKIQWDYAEIMEASKVNAGLINSDNEVLIPFEYSVVKYNKFQKTASVSQNDQEKLWGIINLNNNIVIPIIYNAGCMEIQLKLNPKIAYVCNEKKLESRSVFFDLNGALIKETPFFSQIKEIDEKYYAVIASDYQHGIVDKSFNYVVEPTYTHFNWYHEGYACLSLFKHSKIYNQIIQLDQGEVKLELPGIFKKPDKNGNFVHDYYSDKIKIRDKLSLNKL